MQLLFGNAVNGWYALSLVLLLVFHYLSHRKSSALAVMFGNYAILQGVQKKFSLGPLILLLRAMTLLLVVLVSMDPILQYTVLSNDNHYVLALDTSYSMLSGDVQPTRLGAAKELAATFADSVGSGSDVGVVGFGPVDYVVSYPTASAKLVKYRLSLMNFSDAGGTSITSALFTSANLLAATGDGNRRVVVLLTDGGNNMGPDVNSTVLYLKALNVSVYSIGLGTSGVSTETGDIRLGYDPLLLEYVSTQTGGRFYQAAGRQDIADAMAGIKASVARTEEFHLSTWLVTGLLFLLFLQWGPLLLRYGM